MAAGERNPTPIPFLRRVGADQRVVRVSRSIGDQTPPQRSNQPAREEVQQSTAEELAQQRRYFASWRDRLRDEFERDKDADRGWDGS